MKPLNFLYCKSLNEIIKQSNDRSNFKDWNEQEQNRSYLLKFRRRAFSELWHQKLVILGKSWSRNKKFKSSATLVVLVLLRRYFSLVEKVFLDLFSIQEMNKYVRVLINILSSMTSSKIKNSEYESGDQSKILTFPS